MTDFGGPVIGAVNGFAITGGFELALACDVLSCVPKALRGYERVIDSGFATTFSEGLALEGRASRDHAKSATHDALGERRGIVQERGRSQTRS